MDKLLKERQRKRLDLLKWTKQKGFYTFQKSLDFKSGPFVEIDGKEYKMLSSYDYLGLIGDKQIEKATIEAIHKFGTGSGGVRLLTGTNKLHIELENELANFKGTESAVTFTSGYHANLAVLSSLMDSSDLALVDNRIHQSTIDACKLAGLPFRRFEHNSSKSLEHYLKKYTSIQRVLVITEGMFSMDGDISNLGEIVELKNKYGAFLMVDEAHSLGVLGENGKGVNFHLNIPSEEIDIFTGSLSKAIPSNGGFVAASREIVDFLQHGSSPYIFSAAMGPASTAAALMSIKVLTGHSGRHETLWQNVKFLKSEFQKIGLDTGQSTTPIIPVILGSKEVALSFSQALFERGILATAVVFPAVPKEHSRLRVCVTAAQDKLFLEKVVEVFKAIQEKLVV